MNNGNRIDQVLSRSEAASILQSVDYDLWLIEREIREKYVEKITFDFSYISTEATTKANHLEGLLEPENYVIIEMIGIINDERQKIRVLVHQDYDIMPLTQTCRVKGGKFLDNSNLPLIFIRELE